MKEQFALIRPIWLAMPDNAAVEAQFCGRDDFSIHSVRTYGTNQRLSVWLKGWRSSASSVGARLRVALFDRRVAAVQAYCEQHPIADVGFADFDVLAAVARRNREALRPAYQLSVGTGELEAELSGMSQELRDFLATFEKGSLRHSFEDLAAWILRQADSVGCMESEVAGLIARFLYEEDFDAALKRSVSSWRTKMTHAQSEAESYVANRALDHLGRLSEVTGSEGWRGG